MHELDLKCPRCGAAGVAERQGFLNCLACGNAFTAGREGPAPMPPPVPVSEAEMDIRIKAAVAAALQGKEQELKQIAAQAAVTEVNDAVGMLMQKARETGEGEVEKGCVFLGIGGVAVAISILVALGSTSAPDACLWLPLIFLVPGAALHKHGKKLIAAADEYDRQTGKVKAEG